MFIGTFFFHIMLETYGAYPFLIMMMILNILFYTEHIHEHNHIYIYIIFLLCNDHCFILLWKLVTLFW